MQEAPLSRILELASLHLELALQPYSIAWQAKIIEETTNPPEGVEQSKDPCQSQADSTSTSQTPWGRIKL
jgi:hypothetical protein